MLVNDVTALLASLAKVCQPGLGLLGPSPAGRLWPASGTAAEHNLFCCLSGARLVFLLQVQSFVQLVDSFTLSFKKL